MAAKVIWGENMANALSKVFCCVEDLFGSLLPTTVSFCSHVHGSEGKAPMWNIFEWTNDEWTSDDAAFWNGGIKSSPCKVLSTLQQWLNNRQVKGTRSVPFHPCCLCFLMQSKAWEGFSPCLFWRSAHLGQCQCQSLQTCSAAMCSVIHCHWICSYFSMPSIYAAVIWVQLCNECH